MDSSNYNLNSIKELQRNGGTSENGDDLLDLKESNNCGAVFKSKRERQETDRNTVVVMGNDERVDRGIDGRENENGKSVTANGMDVDGVTAGCCESVRDQPEDKRSADKVEVEGDYGKTVINGKGEVDLLEGSGDFGGDSEKNGLVKKSSLESLNEADIRLERCSSERKSMNSNHSSRSRSTTHLDTDHENDVDDILLHSSSSCNGNPTADESHAIRHYDCLMVIIIFVCFSEAL